MPRDVVGFDFGRTPVPTAASETAVLTLDQYRESLRVWFRDNVDGRDPKTYTEVDRRHATAAAYDAGLLHVTWPEAYGGRSLPSEYQTVFNEESAAYNWALAKTFVTVGILAATLLDTGTEEQKKRHLPPMLRGDEDWAQLLSEPGAGSDLGSVTTRAVRDGDDYVLNGQKVWTSSAVQSKYATALVRTDPSQTKYKGLSMLIVDLSSAGIDIRPLREMTGEALFNEVFLDDVRVPATNLMGDYNGGWAVLNRMLFHERMAISAGTAGEGLASADAFTPLAALAHKRGIDADAAVRGKLADVYIEQQLLDFMGRRMRAAVQAGMDLGPVGSIGKVGTTRFARLCADASVLIGGPDVLAWETDDIENRRWAHDLLWSPMTGIAGGTTEIQKNTIAERLLGLPREPRADAGVPFNQTATNSSPDGA
jgi:alkylation response protein AidB-like acyl-CoA dehydrogenase